MTLAEGLQHRNLHFLAGGTQFTRICDIDIPHLAASAGAGPRDVVEKETVVFATVYSVDHEEEQARLLTAVPGERPMLAAQAELEADWAWCVVDGDGTTGWVEGLAAYTELVGIGVDLNGLETRRCVWVRSDVFLPADLPSIMTEKVFPVFGEMFQAEFLV